MQVKLNRCEPLFATPLLEFAIDDATDLNRRLVADSRKLQADSPGAQISNFGGWHSSGNLFLREETSFQQLRDIVLRCIVETLRLTAPQMEIEKFNLELTGWANISPHGALNVPHDHPGYQWSGCYYVQIPDDMQDRSGTLEFLDPRNNINALGIKQSRYFRSKHRLRPSEGTVVVFPAYLHHWVLPNLGQGERISIAFNSRFRSKDPTPTSP
jgi:uncharacterized protein (TIGR02466 family)